jgi:hypothetical protein
MCFGFPYVAFTNGTLSASGIVMKPKAVGTNWETVRGSSFSSGTASSNHMIFSNAGMLHAAFRDGTNSGCLTLRMLNS